MKGTEVNQHTYTSNSTITRAWAIQRKLQVQTPTYKLKPTPSLVGCYAGKSMSFFIYETAVYSMSVHLGITRFMK